MYYYKYNRKADCSKQEVLLNSEVKPLIKKRCYRGPLKLEDLGRCGTIPHKERPFEYEI
jgi:hypothetical protein